MATDAKTQTIIKVLSNFLSEGGDIKQLKQVVNEFDGLVKKETQEHTAMVNSAQELTADQKNYLEKILRDNFDANLEFEYQVDNKLIAGLVVKVRDFILDMSLSSQLEQISQNLKN